MNREDLAWAAGFFDGEGCFSVKTQTSGDRIVVAHIGQIHPEVLVKFQAAVGVGKVYGPYFTKGMKHERWNYTAYTAERSQALVAMLWNWLGSIKRGQYIRCLVGTVPEAILD